jgi:DNA-directed RNA polymerase subunit RPC12/RpoP
MNLKTKRENYIFLSFAGVSVFGLLGIISSWFVIPAILSFFYFNYRSFHIKCPHCGKEVGRGKRIGFLGPNPDWSPDDDIHCKHCGIEFATWKANQDGKFNSAGDNKTI